MGDVCTAVQPFNLCFSTQHVPLRSLENGAVQAVRKDWVGGGCPERTWVGPVGRKSVLVGQMVGNWVGMVCCWCCFDRRDRSLHSHS